MITNAAVKAARPGARPKKLWDEKGLHILVLPSGHRAWRVRIRAGGKESVVTLGSWPDLGLDQARERRDLVRAGGSIAALTAQRNFEQTARAWLALKAPEWSPVHSADVLASLERDVFPAIGDLPLAVITPPVVLRLLRDVEARGSRVTAGRLRQRISKIFRYAMSEGWCAANPAAEVGAALRAPPAAEKQPAIVNPAELRLLQAAVDQLSGAPVAKLASRFLALTGVRLAGVRGVAWSEIEDLDGDSPLWRIPAARMKLIVTKKELAEHEHLVPLAPAAVAILRAARDYQICSFDISALIFPGRGGEQLGEGAIGDLYDRAGYAGRHVPHGWRASFSTILNEHLGEDWRADIDRALAHATTGKVEGAYNRAQLLGRRRELLETWAQILIG